MNFTEKGVILQRLVNEAHQYEVAFREEIEKKLQDFRSGQTLAIVIPCGLSQTHCEDVKRDLKEAGWEVSEHRSPQDGGRVLNFW